MAEIHNYFDEVVLYTKGSVINDVQHLEKLE